MNEYNKMTSQLELLKRFKIARIKLGHSQEQASEYLALNPETNEPYSARWVVEAIKYPAKNESLYRSVVEYCEATELPLSA